MHSNYIPKIGDLVRVNVWCGRVLDVFTSSTSGEIVVKILFAKNVYKGQDPELHTLADLGEHIQAATPAQLAREIETLERKQAERKNILLEGGRSS